MTTFRTSRGLTARSFGAARIGIGMVLVFSGVVKAMEPARFLAAISAFQLFDDRLSMLIASALPWIEILLGACLVSGRFSDGAILGSVVLFAAFTIVLSVGAARHLSVACGCFGASLDTGTLNGWTIARAGALLLISALLFGHLLISNRSAAVTS